MLKHLTIENFKAWEKAEIDYGSITGFFGANSSGKSSLLQFLLLLKQTVENRFELKTDGEYADLGLYKDFIHNQDIQKSVVWSIDTTINYPYVAFDDNEDVDQIPFEKVVNYSGILKEDKVKITFEDDLDFFGSTQDNFLSLFQNLKYLGPLRAAPKRFYYWANTSPSFLGNAGENTATVILARRLKDPEFEPAIAASLVKLGIVHSFGMEEIAPHTNQWQAKVVIKEGGKKVSLTDVGFGLGQVLPVITLLHMVPENSIVLLEQPELHLHPSAQANLADVIIDVVKTRKIQVIFESHSEQLLLRLQRRIAEEKIASEEVKLYFCDIINGKSELKPLAMDEYGVISNFPEDFMGDAFSEVANAELARIDRMDKKNNHE
jgi:predicted ATPase